MNVVALSSSFGFAVVLGLVLRHVRGLTLFCVSIAHCFSMASDFSLVMVISYIL